MYLIWIFYFVGRAFLDEGSLEIDLILRDAFKLSLNFSNICSTRISRALIRSTTVITPREKALRPRLQLRPQPPSLPAATSAPPLAPRTMMNMMRMLTVSSIITLTTHEIKVLFVLTMDSLRSCRVCWSISLIENSILRF